MPRKQQFSHLPVKKTGQQNEKLRYEDKFISVTTTPLIKLEHETISKRLQNLARVLIRHSCVWNKQVPSELTILKNYIQYYYEFYQFDQFDAGFEVLPSLDVNLYSVSNEINIYKSYNIFSHTIWPIRFHSKFVSKAVGFAANQIKYILSFIMLLAEGNFYGRTALRSAQKEAGGEFGYVVPVQGKCFPHNRFFLMKIFRQKTLLFNVGVQKMPIVRGGVIKRYEYNNYIQILDILADTVTENPQKLEEAVARFVEGLQQDVAKRDHGEQLVIDDKNKKKTAHIDYMFVEYENPYLGMNEVFATDFAQDKKYDYRPLVFKPSYVSLSDTSSLIFDKSLKRWVASDYLTKIEQKALNQYQRKVNQELIKRFVDFQSAKTLVELLTKIPNFKVELTEQEKDVIGENGNVLVIGRSGTGKTTCAVLRLFAIEMLFKIRLSLSKKKYQDKLKDTRCSADDIDKTMGLHCVFLTASPVLTNEIERYYKKLTENIKLELEKKKKKVQEERKKQEQEQKMMKKGDRVHEEEAENIQELKPAQQESKDEEIVEKGSDDELDVPEKLEVKKSKEVIEEQEEMNKELGGIQLDEKIQNEKFEEDQENYDEMKDQLQQKMRKFKSLSDLQESDYPGFFTVKSYIMMIDGTLPKPFFIRKSDEVNEEESQATWHNEKKGVMMIENYYRNQEEDKKEDLAEEEIEEEINYSDEEELQHEYLRQIQLRENKQKQKLTDKLKKSKKALSFEVDYDYFLTYFWPNVRHKHYSARNITPHLVWTEIYSTIKGGASAHLYPGFYLTEKAYIAESTNSFLTKEEKLDVYETFCQYERWKINNGGYDMMDAVNYILNFMRFRGYFGPEIHYVMIDEVQDLPHSIIYLLSKTVRYGVFYSGDTAQTIAKGIGFRFCDLKNLFDPKQFDHSLQLNKPIVKQLTVNFRSHNNILQLANSVVSSIEILFPKTIDRLKKEVSNLSGPKPMILAQGEQELLFYILCGDEGYKKVSENAEEGLKKPPLEFGCDQVIIVRDQQSKNKIPSMLQHALCLTIYEAKGLQFNDVILFNFFSESKCPDKWNLIKYLKVVINEIDAQEYDLSVTKHAKEKARKEREKAKKKEGEEEKKEEEPEELDVECIVDRSADKVNVKKIVSDAKIIMKDINDYAELCSELKMLYTAITRPKNTLIIYDDDSTARKTIEKLWERLEVVELVSRELIEESNKKSNKPESQELRIFKSIVNSTNQTEWKKQGMKMYARGYFEQAMKCFQRSGNDELYKKAQANYIADSATKKLIQIESERKAIASKLVQYQKMSESDLSKLKKKLKRDETATFTRFQEAGKVFEQLLMFKQAGQCYFSGRKYQNAYENFSKAFMNKQAGESLEMLNRYREAAEYYEKQGLYLKVIQCLDLINEWELILRKIQMFAHQMTDLEKKSLFKKYSALALQELVYEIQFENEPEESKPENNRVQVIKEEEDSGEEDWDSDEDPEIAAERRSQSQDSLIASRKLSNISGDDNIMRKMSVTSENEPKRKESLIQEDKVIKESVYENVQDKEQKKQEPKKEEKASKVDESSFADLNESSEHDKTMKEEKKVENIMESIYDNNLDKKEVKEQPKPQKKQEMMSEDNSFAELNESSSSFADLNSEHSENNIRYPTELEPDIESIKSMADPEDPWLQSALSQIQARTNTQYSIVDEDQNYNPNVRIIKTKGNIVVQDQIMRKIVGIVSIVNQSVEEFFRQFKGYQSLITVSKEKDSEDIIDNRPEITEFEDVDPRFINIILDTLQSFKLYKLCLFVCNRYHLPHKAGRYLISMALKYSTNSQINNTLNPALIAPSLSRKFQLQKGILASIALHAMFENVSPDFLKIKVHQVQKQEAKNSLGSYFIEGLILQGLYKKAVFMVNPEESLKILKNFCDTSIYQSVYKQKFLKKSPEEPAEFLGQAPKIQLEEDYTVVKLEEMLHAFNFIHRLDTVSQRYYKEFNIVDVKAKFDASKLQGYTPCLQALLSEDKGKITQTLAKQTSKFMSYLDNGPKHKIYDTVAFLTTCIRSQSHYSPLFNLPHTEFLNLLATLRTIRHTISKKHKPKSYEILQAVLSVFYCRMVDPCRSMKFVNDGYSLVYRISTTCNQFVQELKKNKEETAFFFEQDYNYVLVKTSKLLDIVRKRFDQAYGKFLRARVEAKLEWVGDLHRKFLDVDFEAEQSEYLLKALLREELRIMYPKERKVKKESSTVSKKSSKPAFNYKTQGRPELVFDLESSSEAESVQEKKKTKFEISNFFIFPDINSQFKYLSDLSISLFNDRLDHNNGKMVSGRFLYSAGLNDSYKEFGFHRKDNYLYDAIEFRKFKRLDLYADNILSVIHELSYSERHMLCAQILMHLLIQYKCMVQGKNFKLDLPRRFLKFLPSLKLTQVIDLPQFSETLTNHYLAQKKHSLIFTYTNLFSTEFQEPKEIADLICEYLDILKGQESHKCYNVQKLILLLVINMPNDKEVYQGLREFIQSVGWDWTQPVLGKFRGVKDYGEFLNAREKVLADKELMRNSQLMHQVRVTDCSDIDKCITESEKDYDIKEKILQARAKAVSKIILWWRIVRKKPKATDQVQILKQNRIIKMTHNVKYLPFDDRFILRSTAIRDALLAFYLKNVVSSSLDYHFILMTLNKIEDLRALYIKAYSGQTQGVVEVDEKEMDFEEEIANIESTVQIWKNDSKWLKDRNIDLKRKKVFEVKWMTKSNMQKILKKRAGMSKQKRLEDKKKFLKRHLL